MSSRPFAAEPAPRTTVLNRIHRELGAKMAPFAGWEMPIQYATGILAEHRAVRTAAGLFDISHMGILEVKGPKSPGFLEAVLASRVSRLNPGKAQYSYLLYPDGTVMDDIYVYRLQRERFILVVNAANTERVRDWIAGVNSGRIVTGDEMPAKKTDRPVEFRDLRDAGEESLIAMALQGSASVRVLQKLAQKQADHAVFQHSAHNIIASVELAGFPALVARTGYAGEKLGFEIYIHPQHAEHFWGAVLEGGRAVGVLPAGLGARDSTRIEAGLPLFGREIEGELGISMAEAGYGFVVKRATPSFIGKQAYMERVKRSRLHILRLKGQGRKTLRPGHVILDRSGKPVGQVTSFAYVHADMTFFVLTCAERNFRPSLGGTVRGGRVPADKFTGQIEERSVVELSALTRFPEDTERGKWPARYAKVGPCGT